MTLQTISVGITAISLVIGVIYHINNIKNTRENQRLQLETRQAQLLMGLYETYRSPTFRKQFDHVMFRIDYEDWDDLASKLDPIENPDERVIWFSVASFFEGVGVLLKRNLIDITLIDDLLATAIIMAWEKIGPIEIESRKRLNQPRAWDDFEYLYNKLIEYHKEHPELKT